MTPVNRTPFVSWNEKSGNTYHTSGGYNVKVGTFANSIMAFTGHKAFDGIYNVYGAAEQGLSNLTQMAQKGINDFLSLNSENSNGFNAEG